MRLFKMAATIFLVGVCAAANDAVRILNDLQICAIHALRAAENNGAKRDADTGCTLSNAAVRRNWEKLSRYEKKEYIRAVQCLWNLPSEADPSFSAARNHFDDFVAVHMNLTEYIHGTGNFLTYHRYFMWAWETALRSKCDYKGYLPYWNWFKYTDDLSKSPVFDGSDTSMGGDGEFFPHNGSVSKASDTWLESGKGGGCVTSGPFANYTINLGPISPGMEDFEPVVTSITDYNPRCLRRDLSPSAAAYFTAENLLNVTVGEASANIGLMQDEIQGRPGNVGLHGAGHYGMGADGSDVFSSLNDPAFYFHHTMFDRIFWIWQALHPEKAFEVTGPLTHSNDPPTRNTSADDILIMGVLTYSRPIRDVLDTLGNTPLCYIYELDPRSASHETRGPMCFTYKTA